MSPEKPAGHQRGHHANRPDLAGEHKAGDAGQLILFIVFLIVWGLDSFVLKISTFLANDIAWYFRAVPGIIILAISGYLAWAGLRIVFGEKREKPEIIDRGVFTIVRHPIYLGCILFYMGMIIMSLSLISTGLWIIIIIFYWYISRHEENLLLDLFGSKYENYRKKVPMLFPAPMLKK